jgi:hypothetical protein
VLLAGCGNQSSSAAHQKNPTTTSATSTPRGFTGNFDSLCDEALAPQLEADATDMISPSNITIDNCDMDTNETSNSYMDKKYGREDGSDHSAIFELNNRKSSNQSRQTSHVTSLETVTVSLPGSSQPASNHKLFKNTVKAFGDSAIKFNLNGLDAWRA